MSLIASSDFVVPPGRQFSYQGHGTSMIGCRNGKHHRATVFTFTEDDQLFIYQRNWERARRRLRRYTRDLGVEILYQGKSINEAVSVLNEQLYAAERGGWHIPLGGLTYPDGHKRHGLRGTHAPWTARQIVEWLDWVMAQRAAEANLREQAGLTVDRGQLTETQRIAGAVAELAYRFSRDQDAEMADFEAALNETVGYQAPARAGQLALEIGA